MRRIGWVGALALLTFGLVTPPAGARAAVRCSFDPASAVLRVDARGDALIGIGRGANGDIDVNGNPCGATVFNTDRIRVVGDAGAQSLSICLRCGRLGPGKTHEGTRIDEIEISFEAGHGDDHVQVIGTEHADHLVGSVAGVSLNDDNDVDFWGWGIERVLLAGLGGPDLLRVNGYHGTAVAGGGTGNDVVVGYLFAERLWGGPGSDRMVGGNGKDFIDAGSGQDAVRAGDGNDHIRVGDGEIERNILCGAGIDTVGSWDVGDDGVATACENWAT